jgi:hypothetical protein
MARVQAALTPVTNNAPAVANVRVRYVNEVSEDGWILALEGASKIPLCKYTKVALGEAKNGRTAFTVLDGAHTGKSLSMSEKNATQYLGTTAPKNKIVDVVVTYGKYEDGWVSNARHGQQIDQQWATLTVDGISVKATMNSIWGPPNNFYPIPPGEYMILVPSFPHNGNMTRFYRSSEPSLNFDQVWFPIDFGDRSRFVHMGNVSEGCTTVVDLAKWVDVHEKLISHRSADKKYVGKLIVKGKPERAK